MSKHTGDNYTGDNYTGLEIAIIGMAGRFPGATNTGEYWENLVNGKETISFFTDAELLEAGVDPGELANPNYVKAFGYLEGIENFDAAFFGYTDTEAVLMDPQMRIFLECTWTGLEDAGYNPHAYNGLIGLYTGAAAQYEWALRAFSTPEISTLGMFAGQLLINRDLLGGWVAYKLDLKGPGITMITACSTSLAAIHGACQAILNGECDMAVAGGVSISMLQKSGYIYVEGLPNSPDGHVRAFDAGPHGVVGGNGAAVVVLKPLADAQEDRDHIYALIKGSAINNDGMNKVGFTAPGVEGQARVIKAALNMAEVDPETIGYVETHGTATELGDPVEIRGLTLAFNTAKRQYCRIGSVKTNVGHLDIAAGAAGLIKAALCIYHGLIPASLNYQCPNPKIDFEKTPFYVNAQLSEWRDENNNPRRAGVSSFGLGGANAHAILQEAPKSDASPPGRPFQLLLLSAKTMAALDRNIQNLGRHLQKNPGINLADVAYTLQTGRKAFPYRRMLVTSDPEDREQAFECLSPTGPESLPTNMATGEKRPLVFLFAGQGTQYENMGRELYRQEPQFREEMDHGFQVLESLCGLNLKDILYPSPGEISPAQRDIRDFRYGGPISLLFEYSLAKLLIKWGLHPGALIGYSFGEYTAACLAGVFTLEDALKLAVLRGQMIFDMPEGAMLGVPLSEAGLKPLLADDLYIAAVNGPAFCVVSGSPAPIERFKKELEGQGHECFVIQVPRAAHSPMMAPFKEQLIARFAGIPLNAPGIPYISGLTGTWITGAAATSPAYWARHMSETTRFYDGIGCLLQELDPLFIQVGADRQLPLYIHQHPLKKDENLAINLVRRPKNDIPDLHYLLNGIGQLWLFGADIDWRGFYEQEKRCRIPLPAYSFEQTRYPFPGIGGKIPASSPIGQSQRDDEKTEHNVPAVVRSKRKRPVSLGQYGPPTNDREQKLVDIFQAFFDMGPIGIYDDFYQLGGDSLRAVQLVGQIKKWASGIPITLKELLYHQNIHDLCAAMPGENSAGIIENQIEVPVLKEEISPEALSLMEKKLTEIHRLSGLLKKNKRTHLYEVSPVQASWLGPTQDVSTNFVYYFHDFNRVRDYQKIKDYVETLTGKNSLLRSVIINETGNYYIAEYDSFSEIPLPLIDLSPYSPACRETISERLFAHLNKPMEVFDQVLFRPCVLKLEESHFRLILQIHHLICDGACIDILDKQLRALEHGMAEPRKQGAPATDYYDYVRFMKEQNYDRSVLDILDKYLNPRDYINANKTIRGKYKMAAMKYESFEVDISTIAAGIKEYYNEIAFLAFARSIGELFAVAHVPVEYTTNGRIYKDGNFNHIIGDFHDIIPVLVSPDGEPRNEIDRFIAYNRFIKENNLNFMNYMAKGDLVDLAFEKETRRSPFSFNALIGSTDFFKTPFHEKRLATMEYRSPHFEMLLLEDFSTGKLWVLFNQNSGFTVKDLFMRNYFHLVEVLDKKNF